jgi:hypothetical protein
LGATCLNLEKSERIMKFGKLTAFSARLLLLIVLFIVIKELIADDRITQSNEFAAGAGVVGAAFLWSWMDSAIRGKIKVTK